MRRRAFLSALGGVAATWPFAARAQSAMPVLGFLGSSSPDLYAGRLRAFHQGLRETGYTEGRNVAIEYRWARDQYDGLPALATDLVRQRISVIVAAGGLPAALAAKGATSTNPIVFIMGNDPVKTGIVASLGRPGSNITGVTTLNVEVGSKRLELLHELVPKATVVALLVNPANPTTETLSSDLRAAARRLGLQLHVLHASNEHDFERVFASLAQLNVGGLVIGTDVFFNSQSDYLAALMIRYAVPAIYQYRNYAIAGGLMSYGGNIEGPYRQAGIYSGRILKGEKPADLPVIQVTNVELIVNLKTAKALGVTVPLPLLARADEVIE